MNSGDRQPDGMTDTERAVAVVLQEAHPEQIKQALIHACGAIVAFALDRRPLPADMPREQADTIKRELLARTVLEAMTRAGMAMLNAEQNEERASEIATAAIARASRIPGNDTQH